MSGMPPIIPPFEDIKPGDMVAWLYYEKKNWAPVDRIDISYGKQRVWAYWVTSNKAHWIEYKLVCDYEALPERPRGYCASCDQRFQTWGPEYLCPACLDFGGG